MKAEKNKNLHSCNLLIKYFLIFYLFAGSALYAQVSVEYSDVMKIFTPGTSFYLIPGESGQINIGNMGGPNIYDFTFVNMQNLISANNYSVSQIPEMMSRYPAIAHTFGNSQQSIEESPVFFTNVDSLFFLGAATVDNVYQFIHYIPQELFAKFPIQYNPPSSSFSQGISVYDTTYNLSWQVISTEFYLNIVDVTIDGYGTLKLPGYDLDCLRMRRNYSWFQYKEFLYITKEGVLFVVGNVPASDPSTGLVNGQYNILLSSDLVSAETENMLPDEFMLHQNYPNPFNPATKIKYTVGDAYYASPVRVTLKVYDVLGNGIATLVNEYKPAGRYEVEFVGHSDAGQNLSSGVYFYQLMAGEYIQTKKMILLK